jgi:predicted nucleic acid-binding Zn ribbon protein
MNANNFSHVSMDENGHIFTIYDTGDQAPGQHVPSESSQDDYAEPKWNDLERDELSDAMKEHEAKKDKEIHAESSTSVAIDHAIASDATTSSDLTTYRKAVEKQYDLDWMLQMGEGSALHGHHLVKTSDQDLFIGKFGAHIQGLTQALVSLDAEEMIEDFLDGFAKSVNRQMERKSGQLRRRQDELTESIRASDGTEITENNIQQAQAYCYMLERQEQIAELACIAIHTAFEQTVGRPWVPNSSSFSAKHTQTVTAATASSTKWASRRRHTEANTFKLPEGRPVAITGGFAAGKWTIDKLQMWQKFDKLKAKYDDLVLILTDETGANREAQTWANKNKIPNVVLTADFTANGKSAAFRRNDEVLHLKPLTLLTFIGNGPSQELTKQAKAAGVEILRAA